jgi:hypothetical protein
MDMSRVEYPKQVIEFFELGGAQPLDRLLNLDVPPNIGAELAFKQLKRVEDYVRDNEMGCNVVGIERHYIDRDFMEDYSVFYSRNLWPYPNFCQRIHFFKGPIEEVKAKLREAVDGNGDSTEMEYRERCREFSKQYYYGFSVIKPLTGTPVGRTVLRPFPVTPADGPLGNPTKAERSFEPTRTYKTHFFGAELTVTGIAFQQQDTGVAACATTAIWSSFQKLRDHEDIGATTPAHITGRATRTRSLGRSMPSEGLSIGQMCQAIEAFGMSPILTVVGDFFAAREQLHSVCLSGLVPVLAITRGKQAHAIAIVGMRLEEPKQRAFAAIDSDADRLTAVFAHDDRYGPYLRARLIKQSSGQLGLTIRTMKAPRTELGTRVPGATDDEEDWSVTHILVPSHPKIRLSFTELRRLAIPFIGTLWSYWQSLPGSDKLGGRLSYRVWIPRSHAYLERFAIGEEGFAKSLGRSVSSGVVLSRYLAVLRMRISGHGEMDLLIDSTGTFRNPGFLAVVCSENASKEFRTFTVAISKRLRCGSF